MPSISNSSVHSEPTTTTGDKAAANVMDSFDFSKDYPTLKKPKNNRKNKPKGEPAKSTAATTVDEHHADSATSERATNANEQPLVDPAESARAEDIAKSGEQVTARCGHQDQDHNMPACDPKENILGNAIGAPATDGTTSVPGNTDQAGQQAASQGSDKRLNDAPASDMKPSTSPSSALRDRSTTSKRSKKRSGKKSTERVRAYRAKKAAAGAQEISFFVAKQFAEQLEKSASAKNVSVHLMAQQIVENYIQGQMATGLGPDGAMQTKEKV